MQVTAGNKKLIKTLKSSKWKYTFATYLVAILFVFPVFCILVVTVDNQKYRLIVFMSKFSFFPPLILFFRSHSVIHNLYPVDLKFSGWCKFLNGISLVMCDLITYHYLSSTFNSIVPLILFFRTLYYH